MLVEAVAELTKELRGLVVRAAAELVVRDLQAQPQVMEQRIRVAAAAELVVALQ
jgi:hypothetical protein